MKKAFLNKSRGQVMVEYLIAAAGLSVVLFVGNPSPIDMLLTAIQQSYSATSRVISLP